MSKMIILGFSKIEIAFPQLYLDDAGAPLERETTLRQWSHKKRDSSKPAARKTQENRRRLNLTA